MAYLYKEKYINSIGILGLGLSGISVLNYFKTRGLDIFVWDDIKSIRDNIKTNNFKVSNFNKVSNLEKLDLLFISPGIKLNHPIIILAKKINLSITGDLDIFSDDIISRNDKCIAVTGSNGKSTVSSLINFLLMSNKINSVLKGNIGIPVLSFDEIKTNMTYVLEVSSYQLELMKNIKPNIAILTNLSPDHIERHGNFKNYVKAKERLFMNQDASDTAIINTDSKEGKNIFNKLKLKKNGPMVVEISIKNKNKNIFHYYEGEIIRYFNNKKISLGEISKITSLKGKHNIENILIAINCLSTYGISIQKIKKYLPRFKGLPHRIEEVHNFKNILFVNDSKSTNLTSTKVALSCYENIIWIAGGRRKDESFSILKDHVSNIIAAYFIGESSAQFYDYFNNYFYSKRTINIETALNKSIQYAEKKKEKTVILFSPGCASFDQFKNFEVRGDSFKKLVYTYIN